MTLRVWVLGSWQKFQKNWKQVPKYLHTYASNSITQNNPNSGNDPNVH